MFWRVPLEWFAGVHLSPSTAAPYLLAGVPPRAAKKGTGEEKRGRQDRC